MKLMPLHSLVPSDFFRIDDTSYRAPVELDQVQASFFHEALRPSSFLGLLGAGFISSATKVFSPKILTSLTGFAAEVLAFEGITNSARHYLEGGEDAEFQPSLWESALSLGSLQLSTHFFQASHFLLRHLIQDAAWVASQNILSFLDSNKSLPPSLAQQFLNAEALNLQMAATGFMATRFLPRFKPAQNYQKALRECSLKESSLLRVNHEAGAFPFELHECRLQGGARLLTASPVEIDAVLSLSRGRDVMLYGEKFGDLLPVTQMVGPWPIKNTPLSRMSAHYGIDVVEFVASKAQSASRPLVVLDWGCGQGVALRDLESALVARGIHNVRYFGFSDVYYHRWNEASSAHTFIFDSGFRYRNYFQAGEIDFVMSYYGWSWWFNLGFVKQPTNISRAYSELREVLSPEASFISLPSWRNEYFNRLQRECGLESKQNNATTQIIFPIKKAE